MAAVYSNGGNRWNILGFNFTKRDALSSVYKISTRNVNKRTHCIVVDQDSLKNKQRMQTKSSRRF
jgi:hypothetical protein